MYVCMYIYIYIHTYSYIETGGPPLGLKSLPHSYAVSDLRTVAFPMTR